MPELEGNELTAVIDAEGNFAEGWKEKYVPEEVRDADYWNMVPNFKEMTKQFAGLQSKMGKDKVTVPSQDATDAELNEFFSRVGKPKTPADYTYKPVEGAPERDAENLNRAREFAHRTHLTQRQFSEMMRQDDQERIESIKAEADKEDQELTSAEEALKKLWGMAYEERVHLSNVCINKYCEEDQTADKEQFIAKYGRNPEIIQMLAWFGGQLKEHDVLVANLTQKTIKEAQAELNEITGSEEYQRYISGEMKRNSPVKHEQMKKRIDELYKIIAPE